MPAEFAFERVNPVHRGNSFLPVSFVTAYQPFERLSNRLGFSERLQERPCRESPVRLPSGEGKEDGAVVSRASGRTCRRVRPRCTLSRAELHRPEPEVAEQAVVNAPGKARLVVPQLPGVFGIGEIPQLHQYGRHGGAAQDVKGWVQAYAVIPGACLRHKGIQDVLGLSLIHILITSSVRPTYQK